jgi:hypothetical protein
MARWAADSSPERRLQRVLALCLAGAVALMVVGCQGPSTSPEVEGRIEHHLVPTRDVRLA